MSESRIVFNAQKLFDREDLKAYLQVLAICLLIIYFNKKISFTYLSILFTNFFIAFLFGWYVIQIKIFWVQELIVDRNYIHLKYFMGGSTKTFPRSAVCLKEQEGSWWQRRGINVYVNGHEVETIDYRFDIDEIIAHSELEVERS